MASIASKNLYELLGNDPELDPDREPEPPTKAIDKPVQRAGKRNAGGEGPAPDTSKLRGGGRGGRHEAFSGNEQAFRDRGTGSNQNRSRNPDDGARVDRHPDRLREPGEYRPGREGRGGRGRGRGGRGGAPGDRHSRTGIAEHQKQADQGWGAQTGEGEWNDEKAGEAIAKEEEKEGFDATVPPPVDGEGETWGGDAGTAAAESTEAAEAEEKTKSYAEYLAEQAEKKLQLGGNLQARKPNEGAGKKFPEGKAVSREEEEDFIAGSSGKKIRERERKEKNLLELDGVRMRPEGEDRRGGGRGRGGRGRGEFRGDRPRGEFRGDRGRGGGEFRGDRDRGDRGDRGGRGRGSGRGGEFRPRGGRGGATGPTPNVDDQSAFPSLGS